MNRTNIRERAEASFAAMVTQSVSEARTPLGKTDCRATRVHGQWLSPPEPRREGLPSLSSRRSGCQAQIRGPALTAPTPDATISCLTLRRRHLSFASLAQALVSGALVGCFYALMALGFSLLLGVARAMNLAHGELIVLGGYLGYWLWAGSGLPSILLVPVAAAALLPLGIVWEALLSRLPEPRPLNSLALTFGLSLLLQNAIRALWQGEYRLIAEPMLAGALRVGAVTINTGRLFVAATALAVVGLLWLGLTRTHWGRAVRATSIDPQAAALLGINVDAARRATFLLAVGLAGATGVLFATLHYLYPVAGVELTLMAIVLTIWAGVGRLRSVLVAGIVLGIAEALAVEWAGPRWRETAVALLLLASLFARAGGLARGLGAGAGGR